MTAHHPLISVGIPVRNGATTIGDAIRSILIQDYANVEVVVSDNASTDDTEDVVRELAASDPRIVYNRQPSNIGLLRNFSTTVDSARGEFFRWLGHHDRLGPTCLSRCADLLIKDERLVLVTTQIAYESEDGTVETTPYTRDQLGAEDPATRFEEMMRLLTQSYQLLDPLYSLMRRDLLRALPRRNLLREDEILAAELALLGPWGHVPEVLAFREWGLSSQRSLARAVDAPLWHIPISRELECLELLRSALELRPFRASACDVRVEPSSTCTSSGRSGAFLIESVDCGCFCPIRGRRSPAIGRG